MRRFSTLFKNLNPFLAMGMILLFPVLVFALVYPWIIPYDPFQMNVHEVLTPPGAAHWLGTDEFGRDLLSRLLAGARISLQVALVSVSIALVIGVPWGLVAGFFGKLDTLLMRLLDIFFALPDILLALVVMVALGPSTHSLMLALGLVYAPVFARLVRGEVLAKKENDYITMARVQGVRPWRIMIRHLLPNIFSVILVQISITMAFAVLAESALGFLGFGVEPDMPSWGVMLKEGKDWMEQAWWVAVFPGLAIFLTVFSFYLLGDGMQRNLSVRRR